MCEANHYGQRSKSRPFMLPLGRVVTTLGALSAVVKADEMLAPYLRRHASGDWGEVDASCRRDNDRSVASNSLVRSVYTTGAGETIWIFTTGDRSQTTVLLPEEY